MGNSHGSNDNLFKEITVRAMIFLGVFLFSTGIALAAEQEKKSPSPAQVAQQQKMKSCSADAGKKALKGDERKIFMSQCLKAGK